MVVQTEQQKRSSAVPFAELYRTVDHSIGDACYRVFANAPRNLREFYSSVVAKHEHAPFFVYEDERYTFGESWEIACKVASALVAVGVRPGDRIGIAMRNYPEWAWAFMGATSIGAVAVCFNSWWSAAELEFGMRDSGARVLFVDKERLDLISGRPEGLAGTVVAVRGDAAGQAIEWAEFIASADATKMNASPVPGFEDPATLLYTSGSSSRPKGVLSSQRAIIHGVMGYEVGVASLLEKQAARGSVPEPRFPPAILITAPLFHVTGLNSQFLLSWRLGRKIVAMRKWNAEHALALIERERVTQFSGVPTMIAELTNSPHYAKHDVSSLQAITGGGAAMAPTHSKDIGERTQNRISARTGYAMTETNGLAASHGGRSLAEQPGSVGKAQPPLVDIRIADPDGKILPPLAEGEVLIHGAMNFTAYWNNPEATAATLRQGWVHTGDLGYLDAERFLYLTGRLKDLINRGGEKISSHDVEAAIIEHDAVLECVVFAIPDERLGEVVGCACRLAPGQSLDQAQLSEFLAPRLAAYKIPLHLITLHEAMPQLASGKIDRRAVKSAAIAALG